MKYLYYLIFLHFTLLTVSGQEPVEFVTLHAKPPETNAPVAISLQNELLFNISKNINAAENWFRTHVLTYYPSTNITTIIVGHTLLCDKKNDKFNLILPTIKNIYYSLTRWGLHNEIKVAATFGSSCLLNSNNGFYKLLEILKFMQEIKSPYIVSGNFENLEVVLNDHLNVMKKIGVLWLGEIKVVVNGEVEVKPRSREIFRGAFSVTVSHFLTSRKLSFMDSEVVYPYPARPTPLGPSQGPTGSTNPAYAANTPLPPLVGQVSPPPFVLPFAPRVSPEAVHPGSPHYGPHLPPCAPASSPEGGEVARPPRGGGGRGHGGLWCVAKPSVPPETLQVALDFACGEGGADCEEIRPSGNCYFPETIVAHASYAFNSYWQKTKTNGGTCGFEGTAMLINSDPSYRHCRFNLA